MLGSLGLDSLGVLGSLGLDSLGLLGSLVLFRLTILIVIDEQTKTTREYSSLI